MSNVARHGDLGIPALLGAEASVKKSLGSIVRSCPLHSAVIIRKEVNGALAGIQALDKAVRRVRPLRRTDL